MDAQSQLDNFIDQYSPELASDARAVLGWLTEQLKAATRLVYDNYNALVIAFSVSEKPGDIILSIALYPKYVTLFFANGAALSDPNRILEGRGSTIRGLKLRPISRVQSAEVLALIDSAVSLADPLPRTGEGRMIIKSISAKQRPRRPKA